MDRIMRYTAGIFCMVFILALALLAPQAAAGVQEGLSGEARVKVIYFWGDG